MKKYLLTLSLTLVSFSATMLTSCEKEDKDAISMEDVNKGIQIIQGIDGKEYEVVDLGLVTRVLWATCNMGATSPEMTGSLFAWGETTTKDYYNWSTYIYGDEVDLTKYCTDNSYGTVDNKMTLDLSDEAPGVIMGEGWRIPTETDFSDLFTQRNCTSKWCKLNGVGGFLFTSVRKGYEGNSIFIPLSGFLNNNSEDSRFDKPRFEGEYGWYWCNTIYYDREKQKTHTNYASVLCLQHTDVDNHTTESRPRCVGLPIRPIYVGK